MDGYYKRHIPDVDVSLERGTDNVPDDGQFHLLRHGRILDSFRSEKAAVSRYRELLTEIGCEPRPSTPDKPVSPSEEALRDHFDRMGIFWSEAHTHQRKGGKGRT